MNEAIFREFSKDSNLSIDFVTSNRGSKFQSRQLFNNITAYEVPVKNKDIHHSSAVELIKYTILGFLCALKLIRKKRPEVIFCYSGLPAGFMGLILGAIFKIPYIVSLQGPDIPGFEVRYKKLYPLITPLIKLVWRRAASVITLSKKHEELASATATMHFIRIPNGIDLERFYPATVACPSTARARLLSSCRLIKRKRVDLLLLALSELSNQHADVAWTLTIAGTGDEAGHLKALCSALKLNDKVTFLGFIPPSLMPDLYRAHDIFCMTSEHEGMSMAMLEAIACGLSIVTTEVGGVEELFNEQQECTLVKNIEPEQICKMLLKSIVELSKKQPIERHQDVLPSAFRWTTIAGQYKALMKGTGY